MMVGIIIATHRDICIGGVMTTGIISIDHTWAGAIIVTGSTTTGRKATKITIANIRAGSIKKKPFDEQQVFSWGFFILYNLKFSTCFVPFVAWHKPSQSFYHCGRDRQ